MDFSFASLIEWTKLTVRDPRTATSLVKEAKLPLEVSLMIIVLAGVVSSALAGLHGLIVPPPPVDPLSDPGAAMTFVPISPLVLGIVTVGGNLLFTALLYRIGQRMDGQGNWPDLLAAMAVLQIALTVLFVVQVIAGLALPFLEIIVAFFSFYVFLRALGHLVDVGHGFNDMGKSVAVIVWTFGAMVIALIVLSFIAALFMVTVLGITPDSFIVEPTL